MTRNGRLRRRDFARETTESWSPPIFGPSGGARARIVAPLRRFFDVQAGSIWRDLKPLLEDVRGTVLDVGCGAQPYRGLLPHGTRYVALDTKQAGEHFGYQAPGTLYFEGDVWPISSGTADLVLCTEMLEHVADPASTLSEAWRCLVPHGQLILTVPFAARWHYAPYDYWRFTPSGLTRLLGAAGFTEIQVYARGGPVTVACYKCMALMLPSILPQSPSRSRRVVSRILSLPLVPVVILLAAVARLSLQGEGGNDCLGYTAIATKAGSP